jgi:transposase-like protein
LTEDWYVWALKRLGLKYEHEAFGKRNAKSLFSQLKERTKRFNNRFPYRSSFESVQSWLESFAAFYTHVQSTPPNCVRGVIGGGYLDTLKPVS